MSGKKGQKHNPEGIREEILIRLAIGENQKQISRELGISRYAIQSWSGRRKEVNERKSNPKLRVRPRKDGQPPHQNEKKEIERLRMEKLFARIYEDNTLGKPDNARYARMSAGYETEPKELLAAVQSNEQTVREMEQEKST